MSLPPDPHDRTPAELLRAYGRGAFVTGPQILANQWLPRPLLEKLATRRLRTLIARAIRDVPFYARHLAGVSPEQIQTPADLGRLPFLSRALVRGAKDDLLARGADPARLLARHPPGSSGDEVTVYFDPLTELPRRLQEVRYLTANGVRPWHRQLVFDDPKNAVPGRFALQRAGLWQREVYPAWLPPEEALAQVRARRPEVIHGVLSNLRLLAGATHRSGGLGYRPRLLVGKGEPADPVARDLIESTFGAPLTDCYSLEETGIVAWRCPSGAGHHVDCDLVWVELVRQDGSPCGPGETGEIVLTNLYMQTMPFIRYRLADLGELASEPCPCGRTLPLLKQLTSRKMEPVQTSAGLVIHPMSVMSIVEGVSGVRSYRLDQPDSAKLEVHVRWRDDATAATRTASARLLVERLRNLIGADCQIDVVDVPTMPLGDVKPAGG